MARRSIGAKKHARKFNKMRGKTRVINTGGFNVRGGIRL